MTRLNIVDMFCGGGGESVGITEAAHEFNLGINMSAITYARGGDLLLPDWRSAKEIIDWSIPSQIIGRRRKPLADATMRRIEYGIREFWRDGAVPFIARLYGQSTAESIDRPLSTISCSGAPFRPMRQQTEHHHGREAE